MNIWFISAYDTPEGQSSRTYDYSTELTAIGHKATFFTSSYSHFTHEEKLKPGEKWREEWFGKVRVIWLKTFPYRDNGLRRGVNMLSNAWRAYWVGRSLKEKPDIIFGPSVPLFTGLSAYFLSRNKRCPFCFEVRDIWPQALIDLGVLSKRSPVTWLFRKIEVFLYRNANKIIAVLPFAYKHICKYGIPTERIVWFPNGVNLKRFSDCKPYSGGKANKLIVMYVGGASATHGIDTIIEAAKCMQEDKNGTVHFVFIGADKQKKYYIDTANTYKMKNIEFRGSIPKSKVAQAQEKTDVLVASVRDTPVYQFGINSNKVFDYLASGRPIIFAANAPNNPIADADAGISIPPDDPEAMVVAIKIILSMSPEKRRIMGENGRKYAETHFDVSLLAKKLENILLKIVEK
jgi:glycosyltransferase involved in cell wall biosynthesis